MFKSPISHSLCVPTLMAFSVQGQFDRCWGGKHNISTEKEPQSKAHWCLTFSETVGPGSSAGLANIITAAANACSPATATYTSLTSSCSLMARWWIPTAHHLSGWATVLPSPCWIFFTHLSLLGLWQPLFTWGRIRNEKPQEQVLNIPGRYFGFLCG